MRMVGVTEALILHKQPQDRYALFPQMYLPWNPSNSEDLRGSIPDFVIGRYSDSFPHVRLQLIRGTVFQAKRAKLQ